MMSGKALVVDDSGFQRNTLKLFLEKLNYDVVTSHDGHDAFHKFCNDSFSLLILDQNMPGILGNDLLKKIFEKIILGLEKSRVISGSLAQNILKSNPNDLDSKSINELKVIKSKHFPLIVFFTSDDSDPDLVEKASFYGARFWITKPFNPETFTELLLKVK